MNFIKKKPFYFSVDKKRGDKLVRVAGQRGKSVVQMFRDWIDGLREEK